MWRIVKFCELAGLMGVGGEIVVTRMIRAVGGPGNLGEQATMRYMGFPYAEGAGEIEIDKIAGLKSRDRNQEPSREKLDFWNYGPYDAELILRLYVSVAFVLDRQALGEAPVAANTRLILCGAHLLQPPSGKRAGPALALADKSYKPPGPPSGTVGSTRCSSSLIKLHLWTSTSNSAHNCQHPQTNHTIPH
jgi:hypothetical protein